MTNTQDVLDFGDRFTMSVNYADPQGGPVRLSLLNPPAGLLYEQPRPQMGGGQQSFAWTVPIGANGPHRFVFEVRSPDGRKTQASASAFVNVDDGGNRGLLTGDLNGDGIQDVLVASQFIDVDGANAVGSLFVFAGGKLPGASPTAILRTPAPAAFNTILGQTQVSSETGARSKAQGVLLADLTGDGITDVLACAPGARASSGPYRAGAVYLWKGGPDLVGVQEPYGRLENPNTTDGVYLGGVTIEGQTVLLKDLDGDGRDDVLVKDAWQPLNGGTSFGVLLIWFAADGFEGVRPPGATLTLPQGYGSRYSALGSRRIELSDLDQDGFPDVQAVGPDLGGLGYSDPQPVSIHVWQGGRNLKGEVAASSTLASSVQPGIGGVVEPLFIDLDGNGTLDILARDNNVSFDGGVTPAGAMVAYLNPEAGRNKPTVLFAPSVEHQGTGTFYAPLASEKQFVDVTGDNVVDLLIRPLGTAEVSWYVYSLAGPFADGDEIEPMAVFCRPTNLAGTVGSDLAGDVPLLGDFSGDGVCDAMDLAYTKSGDEYVAHLWAGGSDQGGDRLPDIDLIAAASDVKVGKSPGLWDLDSDGVLDFFAQLSETTDSGSTRNVVAIWYGGEDRSGPVVHDALLVSSAEVTEVSFGVSPALGFDHIQQADVTGDGIDDLVITDNYAGVRGAAVSGAIHVFRGGKRWSGETEPDHTLALSFPREKDFLGLSPLLYGVSGTPGHMVQLSDVTDDGILDVIAVSGHAGASGAGAVIVWPGGPGLGKAQPRQLFVSQATRLDLLGNIHSGNGLILCDLTGDGLLDILVGASYANVDGVASAGAAYLWPGPILSSAPASVRFASPDPQKNEFLGSLAEYDDGD